MSKFQNLFKKNYSRSPRLSQNSKTSRHLRLNIFICIFIFLFVVVYLFQVNGLTNLAHQVQKLENETSQLESAHTKFELQAARLQSIARIKQESFELGFVEVDKIKYINNNDLSIAVIR